MSPIPITDITAAHAAYDRLHALIAGYRCTRGELAAEIRRQHYVVLGAWFGRAMDGRLVMGDDPADGAAHAAILTSVMAEFEQRAARDRAGGEDAGTAAPPLVSFCGVCGGYTRCGHEPPAIGPAGGGLPDTIQVLWTSAHPHRCGAAPRGGQPSDTQQDKILAALDLATLASLRIQADRAGDLVVLAEDDEASTWILGLALHDPCDGWYLGCITCKTAIGEYDAARCELCRRDAAVDAADQVAASEADW
jgi:hypothetical protein